MKILENHIILKDDYRLTLDDPKNNVSFVSPIAKHSYIPAADELIPVITKLAPPLNGATTTPIIDNTFHAVFVLFLAIYTSFKPFIIVFKFYIVSNLIYLSPHD